MKSLKGTFLFSLITVFSYVQAEETMTTWFGDPDLQGTWTNASLTTLERPDNYESLVVTEEQAQAAASITAEFIEEIDNLFEIIISISLGYLFSNILKASSIYFDPLNPYLDIPCKIFILLFGIFSLYLIFFVFIGIGINGKSFSWPL